MDETGIDDQMLIQAARKRLLQELAGGGGDSQHIENNIYGAGGGGGGSGLFDSLSGGEQSPAGEDPFDYFVDIQRQNVDAGQPNPFNDGETFANEGWAKRVHRFRGSKKKAPPMVQEPAYRE